MGSNRRIIDELPERKAVREAYKRLFTMPDGQLILKDLHDSFDGNTYVKDSDESAYKAGQRSVLLAIKAMIE